MQLKYNFFLFQGYFRLLCFVSMNGRNHLPYDKMKQAAFFWAACLDN